MYGHPLMASFSDHWGSYVAKRRSHHHEVKVVASSVCVSCVLAMKHCKTSKSRHIVVVILMVTQKLVAGHAIHCVL